MNTVKMNFKVYKQIENPSYKDSLFRLLESQPNIKQVELRICFSDGRETVSEIYTIQDCKTFINLICSSIEKI